MGVNKMTVVVAIISYLKVNRPMKSIIRTLIGISHCLVAITNGKKKLFQAHMNSINASDMIAGRAKGMIT